MAVSEAQENKLQSFYFSEDKAFAIVKKEDGQELLFEIQGLTVEDFDLELKEDSMEAYGGKFYYPLAVFPTQSLNISLAFEGKRDFKFIMKELYPAPKKMTKSEIEGQLGYPIEIV